MLENSINSLKGELAGELRDKHALQPDFASRTVDIAREVIGGVLQDEAMHLHIASLAELMGGGKEMVHSPVVNNITQKISSQMQTQLHLPKETCNAVAVHVTSFIFTRLTHNEKGEALNKAEILGMVGKEFLQSMGQKLKNLFS